MKTTQLLFSYGTLQDAAVQEKILDRKLKGTKDVLKGYKKIEKGMMNKYPVVQPSEDPKDFVPGTLYHVSHYELYKIDIYESLAYSRVLMTLKSSAKAWVYIPNID